MCFFSLVSKKLQTWGLQRKKPVMWKKISELQTQTLSKNMVFVMSAQCNIKVKYNIYPEILEIK